MIYLAGPYSNANHIVRTDRAHQHATFAIYCATQGLVVYSPISAWEKYVSGYGLPMTPEFWSRLSLGMLRVACELWVLKLDGWESSRGLQEEIRCAQNLGIKTRYFDPENYLDAISP